MTNFLNFFSITLFISSLVLAKGDLAIRAKKLELKLGSKPVIMICHKSF